ncbi:MAG: hypothetical protein ACLPUO_07020 [Streptosporangiaceae bacterium]
MTGNDRTGRGPGEAAGPEASCPECGEPAISREPVDLVPWQADDLPQPQWSHRDGTSLCPVIGPAGYQPAEPQPGHGDPGRDPGSPDPQAPGQPAHLNPLGAALAAELGHGDRYGTLRLQAGTAGTAGRRHMTRVIARHGAEPGGPVVTSPDREPEAGA